MRGAFGGESSCPSVSDSTAGPGEVGLLPLGTCAGVGRIPRVVGGRGSASDIGWLAGWLSEFVLASTSCIMGSSELRLVRNASRVLPTRAAGTPISGGDFSEGSCPETGSSVNHVVTATPSAGLSLYRSHCKRSLSMWSSTLCLRFASTACSSPSIAAYHRVRTSLPVSTSCLSACLPACCGHCGNCKPFR